jgi:subtilisin family serine protease
MDPLVQTRLHSLMKVSSGHPDIRIGIVDGPVDLNHPAFQGSRIDTIEDSQKEACKNASDLACIHGTFVTGIICAKRGVSAHAICPDCQIIINPIFGKEKTNIRTENDDSSTLPNATPEELPNAIMATINAGAKIINLSLGLDTTSLTVYDGLQQAYDYALRKGVIIVIAAGNQGNMGNVSLINHQWIIPVAACDENSRIHPMSNFGPSIGRRGLLAPGVNITSTYPGGQYGHMSGTSFAVPFVTGTIALLWSMFPKATAAEIIHSVVAGTSSSHHHPRSIIPPLLNAEAAWNRLKGFHKR